MDKQIKQILKDVYSIDKGLKMHEQALVKIIQELLRSKPENKIDENFVRELRAKLVERVRLLKESQPRKNMFNTLFNKRFAYAFAGTALIICAIVVFMGLPKDNGKISIKEGDRFVVKDVGENAFGDISFSQQIQGGEDETYGGKGGGGLPAEEMEQPITMPAPNMVNYNYTYNGEDFEVSGGEVVVYQRIKGDSISKAFANVLGKINLSFVDFDKFRNTKINSLEILEDREFGYQIQINPRQNIISIYANWEKWPREGFDAPSEMPNDEEIIAITDKFLADYGISLDMYGKGDIVKTATFGVVSEYVSVVYPLKINGQIAYDQTGHKYGIRVGVNLKYNKAISVSGINANIFESSQYTAEADKDKIMAFAKDGGLSKNYVYPNATKTVNVELGTPKLALIGIWQFSPEDKTDAKEIFVPSLIFPIINMPDWPYINKTNVVVPLVGEMLDQQNNPIPGPRVFQ